MVLGSRRDWVMYKEWSVLHKEIPVYCKQPPCPVLHGIELLSSAAPITAGHAPLEGV